MAEKREIRTKEILRKRQNITAICLDIIIFTLGTLGTYIEIYENGMGMLGYYTVDSNILIDICCLLDIAYQMQNPQKQKKLIWIKNIKYFGTCCMSITFGVVFFVLAPMGGLEGYLRIFFEGALKYHHFLCPVLTIFSFVLIDAAQEKISRSMVRAAVIPTVLYAVITTVLNIARIMHGPYPFLYVYEQSFGMSVFWCVLILGMAYLAAWFLWKVNQVFYRRVGRKTYEI